MKRFALLLVLLSLLIPATVFAQGDPPPAQASTEALVITWPPPVTEVWGTGDVLGTVNVPDMAYYYLEYKHLNADLTEPANAPWLPASVGLTDPVINGTLATLDTTTAPDGLYVLRLTAATEDGQVFHYSVSPIRVNNARFRAVEERIRNAALAAQDAAPTPPPTAAAPPTDTTPRVKPAAGAVNMRRCTLVDNDRCPAIQYLQPNTFGTVIGRLANNSWYQIRLNSGVTGWVINTVIVVSGDFSAVPIATPPDPLAPAAPAAPQAPPAQANVAPNGMEIEGGQGICNQPFNVRINVNNAGNIASAAGSVTLQDVNVGTGEITFTGYGNYPVINPSGNYVIVIPVTTSLYYNAQHELRAFANGRQYSIRYTLEQGNCNLAPPPNTPVPPEKNTFSPGECRVVLTGEGELSLTVMGEVSFLLPPGTYTAMQKQQAGGVVWYQVNYADAPGWIPSPNIATYEGNCGN